MLKIRLARGGAKKRPYYSIVIADSHSPRDGRFIEKVGTYNPLLPKDGPNGDQRVTLKAERIQDWLKKGAQPTDRVARFLSKEGLAKWEASNNPTKGKPGKKSEERTAERAQRETDRAEAEAAAKAEAAEAAATAAAAAEPEPEAAAAEPEPEAEAPVEAAAEEAPAAETTAEEAAQETPVEG